MIFYYVRMCEPSNRLLGVWEFGVGKGVNVIIMQLSALVDSEVFLHVSVCF